MSTRTEDEEQRVAQMRIMLDPAIGGNAVLEFNRRYFRVVKFSAPPAVDTPHIITMTLEEIHD